MVNRIENRAALRAAMKNKQFYHPSPPPRNSKTSPVSVNDELRRLSSRVASDLGYSQSFVKAQTRALKSEKEHSRLSRTYSSFKDTGSARGIRTSASPYFRGRFEDRTSNLRAERRSSSKSRVRFSEIIQPVAGDKLGLDDSVVYPRQLSGPKQAYACTQTDPVLIIQPISLNEILKKQLKDLGETSENESKTCIVNDDVEKAGNYASRTPRSDVSRTPRNEDSRTPRNDVSRAAGNDASKRTGNGVSKRTGKGAPERTGNDASRKTQLECGTTTKVMESVPFEVPLRIDDKKRIKDLAPFKIDPDKIVLRYVIGKGGFGTVYKAEYDGKEVAVKLLKCGDDGVKSKSEVESIGALYKQEAALWEKLDHPNITKFIGSVIGIVELKLIAEDIDPSEQHDDEFVVSEVGCIVEEYLTGGNVRQLLHKHQKTKLEFDVVMNLVLDLARGLSYIHSQAVVHRDIKTDNLLLDNHLNLKIADFGVSRLEAKNPRDMTGETGTRGYMAPEVTQGKPYNRKCDVYSFGICLWEIYCCESALQNTMKGVFARKSSVPSIPKCCPHNLANIMRKCWSKNPEDRPEMNDVVAMLEAIDIHRGIKMQCRNSSTGCFCFSV